MGRITGQLISMAIAILLLAPGLASAQTGGSRAALTYEIAERAADAAEAEARANGWNVTIVVSDVAGIPVYLKRLTGASAFSYQIAFNKARTSAATGLETDEYGRRVQAGEIQAVENGVTFAGGIPIRIDGEVVGAIGTSGVRADQDAQISRAGVAAIGGE